MSADPMAPRVQAALDELRGLIRARYPDARFDLARGADDPAAIHLIATVDVADTEDIVDLVIEPMMRIQIEDELPIFVIPVRPIERVVAGLREPRAASTGASGRALIG